MQLTRLGPYDLEERLGKGGMGTVYRATHRGTGEVAAVKALAPNLAAAEGFRDRFEAEIESLKLLRHPGIVRLLGYGEEDGVLFYAMELVDGTSLEEELRAGHRFTWLEVTDYSIQICRALKHAHDHGVIHRDIKPANLLVDREGRIKIADFGIARLFGATQLTSAGGVLGTADYMSPEQTDGRNVNERCDQYSLGGVMYALLAGRPPFRASNLPEMLQLQRYAEPEPVRRYAPETPPQLERLIMQLLSKDPAERFPNTLVLARHMEAMRRALSRPAADDFALSAEAPPQAADDDPVYDAIAMETTRIEPSLFSNRPVDEGAPESLEGISGSRSGANRATERGSQLTGPFTSLHAAEQERESAAAASSSTPRIPTSTGVASAARPRPVTRFRTVDEDFRATQHEERPSRLLLALQILGLVTAIALLGTGVWYFSRPASADDLYSEISLVADEGKVESLRRVEGEIRQFLDRFPNDPRAEEVAGYKDEIDLSRLEGEIYRRARRRTGGQSLAAIEQMYLDAVRKVETEPAIAMRELHSILVLYGVASELSPSQTAAEDATEGDPPSSSTDEAAAAAEAREYNRHVQDCLKLIERRLARLARYMEMEADKQLPVLERRLIEARELEAIDPARSRSIYIAILDLFDNKPWATPIVRQAAAALQRLDANAPRGRE